MTLVKAEGMTRMTLNDPFHGASDFEVPIELTAAFAEATVNAHSGLLQY